MFSTLPTIRLSMSSTFFFFNDTATTEIYTLSLHDALPIYLNIYNNYFKAPWMPDRTEASTRSEERFSRNAETDLVCRLLLEKKKKTEHVVLLERALGLDRKGERRDVSSLVARLP